MNRFRNFMMNRNGGDHLGIFLIILSLAISIIFTFVPFGPIKYVFIYLPLALAIFRMFSKNIAKRRAENYKFMAFIYKIKNGFKKFFEKIKGSGTYKYFRCPSCRQELRIPRGKGKVIASCPKCHTKFEAKT